MKYKILLGLKAIKDIQKAIDWYNRQGPGLESNKAVFIRAVLNTSLNPEKWKEANL